MSWLTYKVLKYVIFQPCFANESLVLIQGFNRILESVTGIKQQLWFIWQKKHRFAPFLLWVCHCMLSIIHFFPESTF